jgi:hypothetical protein
MSSCLPAASCDRHCPGDGGEHEQAAGELHRGEELTGGERGEHGKDDGFEGRQDGGGRRAGAPRAGGEGEHRPRRAAAGPRTV